jgi:hypothetical protein
MTRFWRSTGSWMLSRSPLLGSVVLESLLATDSVMRVRGGSAAAAASWVPFSCMRCECSDREVELLLWLLLTRLRLREGVAMESGVSASDCCASATSLPRVRRLRLLEGGIVVDCVYVWVFVVLCVQKIMVSECVCGRTCRGAVRDRGGEENGPCNVSTTTRRAGAAYRPRRLPMPCSSQRGVLHEVLLFGSGSRRRGVFGAASGARGGEGRTKR